MAEARLEQARGTIFQGLQSHIAGSFPSLVSSPYNLRPSVDPARRFVWDCLGTAWVDKVNVILLNGSRPI